jgi:hypothetical protein
MTRSSFGELQAVLDEPPEAACQRLVDHLYAVLTRPRRPGQGWATVRAAGAILSYLRAIDSREPRRSDVPRLARAVARVEQALASERRVAAHAKRRAADLASRAHKRDLPSCGARCRTKGGAPCAARVAVRFEPTKHGKVRRRLSNRCRMHGGLSTGPRTREGRERCREAGRRGADERWRRYRAAREWWR